MTRRLFFRLSFLLPLFMFAALILSTQRGLTAVHSSQNKPAAPTEGRLLAVDEEGNLAGQCPLKHTDVKREVSGFISRVTSRKSSRTLSTRRSRPSTFPAAAGRGRGRHDDACWRAHHQRHDHAARGGAGRLRRRPKPGGQSPPLDQERPTSSRSRSPTSCRASSKVTISYVETLEVRGGHDEWSFPMVVGPRYIPGMRPTREARAPAPDTYQCRTRRASRRRRAEGHARRARHLNRSLHRRGRPP